MKKQGRNEACACGSGKKYKKCCGSNVVTIDGTVVNERLSTLQNEFDAYLGKEVVAELTYAVDEVTADVAKNLDQQSKALFTETIIPWLSVHYEAEAGRTLFSQYYQEKIDSIQDTVTKRLFKQWLEADFSAYVIQGIDGKKQTIQLEDLLTNEQVELGYDEVGTERIGDILVGVLVPYFGTKQFLIGALTIQKEASLFVKQLLANQFKNDKEQLKTAFPEFLIELFMPSEQNIVPMDEVDLQWEHETYETVATQLKEKMAARNIESSVILTATIFWNKYSEINKPNVTKAESYAAALDYYVCKSLAIEKAKNQKQLADIYGTTSSTISSHHQEFTAFEDELQLANEANKTDDTLASKLTEQPDMDDLLDRLKNGEFKDEAEMIQYYQEQIDANRQDNANPITKLIKEAEEASGEKRKQLINQILQEDPTTIDAYILLAQEAKQIEEAKKIIEKAVELGEKKLGETFFQEKKGQFWGYPEARPYLRAKAQLALINRVTGQTEAAIRHCEELLQLNPLDHLAIRETLIPLYIEKGDIDQATKRITQYDEDSTLMAYSKALIHYMKTENKEETKQLFEAATTINAHVIPYLTGEKQVPQIEQATIERGAESEAIVYVQNNGHLWEPIIQKIYPERQQ